ncbi:MAG: hypothetical protein AAF456_01970 [Planctomycetota bacterium]
MGKKSKRRRKAVRNRNRKRQSSRHSTADYRNLEPRHLLAVSAVFNSGTLDVTMDSPFDVASINVNASSNVTINGSDQISDGVGGFLTVPAALVSDMTVAGNPAPGGDVILDGIYSLNSLSLNNIGNVDLAGAYSITGNLAFNGTAISADASASLTVLGDSSFIASSGDIDFDNSISNYDFVGEVAVSAASGNVAIADVNHLTMGATFASASLSLIAGGPITQSPLAAFNVAGATSLNSAGDITMINPTNDFGDEVDVSTSGIALITDANDILFDDVFADQLDVSVSGQINDAITSTLNVSTSTSFTSTGGDLILDSQNGSLANLTIDVANDASLAFGTGDINFSSVDVGNDLMITTQGDINGGAVSVGNTATIASGGAIQLPNANNDFQGEVNIDNSLGNLTVLRDQNGITFDQATLTSAVITAGGDVTQTPGSSFVASGSTTIDTSGDVVLNNFTNDFQARVNADGVDIKLSEANSLLVGDINATGEIQLITSGQINQASGTSVNVAGSATLSTGAGIALSESTNDFSGDIDISAPAGSVAIGDTNDISLGNVSAADLNLTAGSSITENILSTINVGNASTLNAESFINLDSANSSFGALDITSIGNADFSFGSSTIHFSGANVGGDLSVESDVDITGGPVSVTGSSTFVADGNVTLNNAANDFAGPVNVEASSGAGQMIDINDANSLVAGNIFSSDSLTLTSGTGISQEPGSVVNVAGATSLTATTGSAELSQFGNDFDGTIAANASGLVSLADVDGIMLASITASDLVALAAGNITDHASAVLTISNSAGLIAGANVTIDSAASTLGAIDVDSVGNATFSHGTGANTTFSNVIVSGDFSVTSDGDISIDSASVTGTTAFVSGGNITANNSSNIFAGAISVDANDIANQAVTLSASSSFVLDGFDATGNVTIGSGGNLSQNGGFTFTVGGDSALNVAGNIELTNAGNDFTGTVGGSAINFSLNDQNNLSPGYLTALGNLSLESAGDVAQTVSTSIAVSGAVNVDATSGAVTLDSASNDFGSTVAVDASGDITLGDANLIELADLSGANLSVNAGTNVVDTSLAAIIIPGATSVTAGGDIVLDSANANVPSISVVSGGSSTLSFGTGDIAISSASITGTLTVDSPGNLNGGPVSVGGASHLETVNNITLTNAGNDFVGIVHATSGGTIDIHDSNDLALGDISSVGATTVTAVGQNSQGVSTTIAPGGDFHIQAGGNATFDQAGNDFGNVTADVAGALTLTDANDIAFGNITAGSLDVSATGSIADNPGAALTIAGLATFDAGTTITIDNATASIGSISVTSISNTLLHFAALEDININDADVGGNFSAMADGSVFAGPVRVSGTSSITASGDVNFTHLSNDFTGSVTVDATSGSAQNVALTDLNQLILHNVGSSDSLNLVAGVEIVQFSGTTINAPGNISVNAGQDIFLNNAGNEFGGEFAAVAGNDINVSDANSLILSDVAAGGNLDAAVTNFLSQAAATAIAVTGTSSFTALDGILLANSSNDFTGEVESLSADSVSITDVNDFLLGDTLAFDLAISSGGSITDVADAGITINDTTTLSAASFIDIDSQFASLPSVDISAGTNADLGFGTSDINIASATVGGNLSVTSADGINGTQVHVTGTTTLVATGDISLDDISNDFQGVVDANSQIGGAPGQITIYDANDLSVGNVTSDGSVDLLSFGSINQHPTSAFFVVDITTIDAAGNVTLDGANEFVGPVDVSTTGQVVLNDVSDLAFEDVTASTLTATAIGAITDTPTATLNVSTSTNLTANTITLDSQNSVLPNVGFNSTTHTTLDFGTADITITSGNAGGNVMINSGADISSSGAVVVGGTTTLSAGGNIELTDSGNDFTGQVEAIADSGTGQAVSITDNTDLLLHTVSSSGNLSLASATGNISQTGGSTITATGNATLNAAGDITLGNAGNDIGGSLSATANKIVFTDVNNLTFGPMMIADAATISSGGQLTQEVATSLMVGGLFNAVATGDVDLGNGVNDFAAAVSINSGGTVSLGDVNGIDLGDISGTALEVDAAGDVADVAGATISISGTANIAGANIAINNATTSLASGISTTAAGNAELTFGTSGIEILAATVTGNLTVAASDSISGGAAVVGGSSSFVSTTGSVTLNNAANNFTGPVTASGTTISIVDTTSLSVEDITTTSTLSLSVAGDIAQLPGTTVTATGDANINASGNVTLDGNNNDFSTAHIISGGSVVLDDLNDINLGNFAAATLDVTAGGNITDDAAVTIAITTSTTLDSGADITLDNATTSTGGLSVESTGSTVLSPGTGDINITQAVIGADLTATSPGNVTAGPVTVGGNTQFAAGGNILATNVGNTFTGSVSADASSASGQSITLFDSDALTIGNVVSSGTVTLTAGGDIIQSAATTFVSAGNTIVNAAGNLNLSNNGNDVGGIFTANAASISLTDANDVSTGNISANGDLTIDAGGQIVQTPGTTISVTGNTDVSAGSGPITFGEAGNNFGGTFDSQTSGTLSINDVSGIELVDVNAAALNIVSSGDVLIDSGSDVDVTGTATISSAGGVTISGANHEFGALQITAAGNTDLDFGNGNVNLISLATGGNLSLNATGDLTAGGALSVSGTTTLTSGGSITANNAANDFGGAVSIDAGDLPGHHVSIADANALSFGNVTSAGDFTVNAGGAIQQNGGSSIIAAGATIATAVGNVDFSTSGDNNFNTVSITTNGNVDITEVDDIVLQDLTAHEFSLIADGSVSDDVGATIGITGGAEIDAGGNLILDSTNSSFAGELLFQAATGNLTLVSASGDLSVSDAFAGGNFMISGPGNVELLSLDAGGDAAISAGGNLDLGETQVMGNLTVNATGDLISGPTAVGGSTNITTSGTVNLSNPGNSLGGTVSIDNSAGSNKSVTLRNDSAIEFGNTSVSGALVVDAEGHITQQAATSLSSAGDASFDADGNILVDNDGNTFGGTVMADGNTVAIHDESTLTLGNVNAIGDGNFSSAGDLTQNPATSLQIAGTTDFDADGNITITDTTNNFGDQFNAATPGVLTLDFTGDITLHHVSADQLTLTSSGDIFDTELADINIASSATINTSGGVLFYGATGFLTGLDLTAGKTSEIAFGGGDIQIDNADITGDLMIDTGSTLAAADATFDVTGTTLLVGFIVDLIGATVTTNDLIAGAAVNNILNGSVLNVGGNADIAGDQITASTATFNVTGTTFFDSIMPIDVSNPANDFTGAVSANHDLIIKDANDLKLGNISSPDQLSVEIPGSLSQATGTVIHSPVANNLQVAGDISLNSPLNEFSDADTFTITANVNPNQNVSIADATDLNLGSMEISGNLTAVAGGELTADTLVVGGSSSFTAGKHIVVTDAGNDFTGPVSATTLGDDPTDVVTLRDVNDLILGNVNTLIDLDVATTGSISQQAGTTINIPGVTSLAGFNVSLDSPTNDFSDKVHINANGNASISDVNDLDFGGVDTGGDLTVVSGGNITAELITTTGGASFTAEGSVTLDNAPYDFVGPLSINATVADVTDINEVVIGEIQLGEFNLAADGNITGSDAINVSGEVNITTPGDIGLTSTNSNFGGNINLNAVNVDLSAGSDLNLDQVTSTGNLSTTTTGTVTNVENANINVGNNFVTTVGAVSIGGQTGDAFNAERLSLTTTGHAQLSQDSNIRLLDSDVGSLQLSSTGRISNAPTSTIEVAGVASFEGTAVVVGTTNTDSFDAGSVNFASTGAVNIHENSSTELSGDSTAQSATITSDGALTNSDASTVEVTNLATLNGSSINIGDAVNDSFNAGFVNLVSAGDVTLTEDSRLLLFGATSAANLTLTSTNSAVVDSNSATTDVSGTATFAGNFVMLGEKLTDSFNAGSISFNVNGNVRLTENSATVVTGNNSANAITITSSGTLFNLPSTSIFSSARAQFTAENIALGTRASDSVRLASLTFTSEGRADIHEDNGMFLFGANSAGSADLRAAGSLIDSGSATLHVTGNAAFEGTSIRIGDTATDNFTAGTMTFNSTGNVFVAADSNAFLSGDNSANNLTLLTDGFIGDLPTSTTNVAGALTLNANGINIGTDANQLSLARLNVNSAANVNISSATSFFLFGNNVLGDELRLSSQGNITDSATASTIVENAATFNAVDVIIGDVATDCFDIVAGIEGLVVAASGIESVTFGCP